jgi:SAM-dependent methyltransferase
MRRQSLAAVACPRCQAALLGGETIDGGIEDGTVRCANGHVSTIHRGVLDALPGITPDIIAQRAENARERRGALTPEEKAAYRQNISRIGKATYNQLIRDNARGALDAMGLRPGWSLDLGGGSGWLAAELARRGYHALSLDIEDPWERAAQVAEGETRRDFELVTDVADIRPGEVDFVVGDMNAIPFRDQTFDLVTMSAALHHSEDPVRTLKEAARVLKPGGVLLCLNEPVKGWFRDERPILHGRNEEAGEHLYSAGAYLGFLRRAGLEARLHFPGWVDRRLRERDWQGVVYYRPLLPLVGGLWRLSAVRALCGGPLLRPAMNLFGLTLIAEARKPAAP